MTKTLSRPFRSLFVAAAFLTPAVAMAAPQAGTIVQAQQRADRPTAFVKVTGRDLASDAGVKNLRRRVERAAGSLCIENSHRDLRTKMLEMTCVSQAMSGAEWQISRAIDQYRSGTFAATDSRITL